ncbi:MAG: type II toxin-antitoxin system HicA family toxin [Bryobacteraceae bacterium]|nr:type II toxin-antitoxin system HicA family toxin [Solibacteraceae bacterium]MCO5350895.1 type II toxin-antitoxin system HicA family toxin [Bryobacteraceae bacterium]
MKRIDLIRHLKRQGCVLLREGDRHTVFFNELTKRSSTVPRHREINDFLVRKICTDLQIPRPR